MNKLIIYLTLVLLTCISAPLTYAGWDPEEDEREISATKAELKEADATIESFKNKDLGLKKFFKKAYGYAVFPNIGKGAFILGGAHGSGILYQKGDPIGRTKMTQFTVGFQAGGQSYSEIIFFKNKKTFEDFKSGNFEFGAQVSAVAVKAEASANAEYSDGVAIFTMAKGGFMYEASVGGQKFEYKPFD